MRFVVHSINTLNTSSEMVTKDELNQAFGSVMFLFANSVCCQSEMRTDPSFVSLASSTVQNVCVCVRACTSLLMRLNEASQKV